MANAPIILGDDEEEDWEYDEDGNPIAPERSKVIDPLPPVDHNEIEYIKFEKNFYDEHSDVTKMSHKQVVDLRKTLGIKVTGPSPSRPCVSFGYFGFDEHLLAVIRKSEFTQPTPIQAQAIPCALSGRDVIGIAKTGSGKTVAYLWPMLLHIMDQPELAEEDGPIALICAPTRELCQQIYHEARKYGKAYGLGVCAVFGGASKWEQVQALKECPEILVATPGRLIDLVKCKATNLQRVTYLVFDEADRMFDMGFEVQVRSIANHVRPDRQTLLFSATFRKKVEKLCRDVLIDPVRILVGELGEANTDITQMVEVLDGPEKKWEWLSGRLVEFTSSGSVLVFVTKKADSELVAEKIKSRGMPAGLLHGDMGQGDRDNIILGFKKGNFPVLVATDVAARGLDIPSIKTVVNFDVAKSIDTHVHRIGRTGRAGEKGYAYTLVSPKDTGFAGDLVRNLEGADQEVPEALMQLAMQSSRFRKSRFGQGKGRGGGGKKTFAPRQRPGLGSTTIPGGTQTSVSAVSRGVSSMGSSVNRAQFLREAFSASYKSSFKSATSASSTVTSTLKAVPPPSSYGSGTGGGFKGFQKSGSTTTPPSGGSTATPRSGGSEFKRPSIPGSSGNGTAKDTHREKKRKSRWE
jgi:ATP-dependent RNA helicase DDX42